MALNSANVDVALTGAVSYAPVGSTAPTDAETPLDAAFEDVGYISSDGVVETRDRSTSNIVAWQNADVIRSVVTEASLSVQFTMVETKKEVLELFYGTAVDDVTGSLKINPGAAGTRYAVVVDYADGDKWARLYIPQAEVLEVGEVTLASSGDPVGYNVTLRGYPDSTLGATAQKFWSALIVETP